MKIEETKRVIITIETGMERDTLANIMQFYISNETTAMEYEYEIACDILDACLENGYQE